MEYDYEHLESMFESNPLSAIEQSQAIICQVAHFDTYKEFYTYHLENAHISTCQSEWSTPELCIFCRECGLVNQACVCLSCFLNGNHDGHDYVVLSSVGGNCDCGDTEQWRRSGFCDKHRGLDDENSNPEDYLDEKLKTVLTDVIFRAAFTSLKKFTNDKNEESNAVIQFVASFLKFGDGFRRLVARSLTEKTDLKGLMLNIINYDTEFNRSLQQLCGGLVNDQLFIRNFSGICYEVLIESVLKDSTNIMFKGNENVSYAIWNDFWFHCYSEKILEYYINQKNWDWVKFFTESLTYFKELLLFVGTEGYNEIPQSLITIVYRVFAATQIQPNEETQRFFDQVFTVILADKCQSKLVEGKVIEMNVITSFKESTERLHFFSTFHFIIAFFELFNGFKNKPNLKFDVLFDMLKKTIDISPIFSIGNNFVGNSKSNENDKLVLSFLKNDENNKSYLPTNYKSFHNGGSFYILNPLFSSLMSLFMIDDISKEKIASFFSLEENQSLRIKLGIINLRTIVSYICHRQNIASAKNIGIDFLYSIFDKPNMVSNFFPNFIPIFQLLLGLQCSNKSMNEELCLKEFFAFELAREIGIFDDFTSNDYKDENVGEKQKQMIFSFLYLSLLFVIERNMFHFDGCNFIQEQIIFALKNGIHSIDKLNKLYDTNVFKSWQHLWGFNDVLMKVATTTASSKNISNEHENDNEDDNESHESAKSFQKDVSFYLKDDAEWKPISAIISINGQMTLMNNQISKNPDQLLKIQEFEPEETFFFPPKQAANENDNDNEIKPSEFNIHLKQFLMTPTVLSIVYNTLRTSAGIDSTSSDLNDHLAMNILILVSKLVKDKNSEIQAEPINSTNIHYKSLNDLISQMKNIFFKYQSDGILTKLYRFMFKRNEPKKNDGNATIENILNPANFVSLLKMKFSSNNLPPKSFIDVLLEKGKLGHDVLNRISENVHLDCFTNEEQSKNREDVKQMKHQKAAKLKEDIMNHYKSMIANYSASNQLQQKGADSIDDISSVSASEPFAVDKEVCSICSTYKKNEIFSYPLYIYRTKFPFIIDKPPLFRIEEVEGTPIDDVKEDYHLNDSNENNEQENDNDNDENAVDPNVIMAIIANSFPQLFETEGLNEEQREERKNTINMLFNAIMQRQLNDIKSRKQQKNFNKDFKKEQQEESELYEINKEKQKEKRFTAGANFIIQFGICQHSVHPKCVHDPIFPCPIDRSIKNGLLPSIDGIPKSIVFKDLKTFEVNKEENSLAENIIDSISSFIDNFSSFFYNNPSLNVFIELIKSISGLISTYEIRLRSLPDCLDSEKTKLLSRNLFLVAWYAYRIQGKPKISIPGNEEIDCESRMTVFQRFIKRLIEEDDIEKDESNLNQIISSIVSEIKEDDLNRKEKEICLLLRRIVLSEHFLLNKSVYESNMNDIIDWDDILSPTNLSQRYNVKFTTIDDCFEFSPFIFQKLPKEFLRFSQKPFNLPVNKNKVISLFNILDYNFLINNYDEINCEIKIENNIDEEIKRNNKNLKSCDEKNVGFFFDAFYSCKHYPTVLLFIGNYASQLFVVDQDFFAGFNPFYLDKYGCADIGFKRGQPLFINDEKYERFIDIILSGDFANSLIPINRLKQD